MGKGQSRGNFQRKKKKIKGSHTEEIQYYCHENNYIEFHIVGLTEIIPIKCCQE